MHSPKWQKRFMCLAEEIAEWSDYDGTHVGCVIVGDNKQIVSQGYNGLPRGVHDLMFSEDELEGFDKYLYYEHAERNALYNALLNGSSVTNNTMYATHFPCADCARGIIQSGIKTIYYKEHLITSKWLSSSIASIKMFESANIAFGKIEE